MSEVAGVPVEERAVVFGEVLSGRLVFSKVPASGQFGLQRLVKNSGSSIKVLHNLNAQLRTGKSVYTNPNFPQEVTDDVQS